jgi:RNA polymerase subunit RPABC4/transcription elongation factor Spt4
VSDEGITKWHSVIVLIDQNIPSEPSHIAAELTIRIPVLANSGVAL